MASSDDRAHEPTLAAVTPTASGDGAPSVTEPPRQVIAGRYEILGLLGVGGMGSVYKVRDRSLDEVVALKVLRRASFDAPGALERCPLFDPLRSTPRFDAARTVVAERRDAVLRAWDES